MATYSKRTGSSGTMYIVDNGSTVEFVVNPGNSATRNGRMPWRYTINGHTSTWQYYNLTGGGGNRSLGKWTITLDQTVIFELGNTQTSGLGGPTSFSQFINRVGTPTRPTPWRITQTWMTVLTGVTDSFQNGGSAITRFEVAYNTKDHGNFGGPPTDGTTRYQNIGNNGAGNLNGLSPAKVYYIWTRAWNVKGASDWSPVTRAATMGLPIAKRPSISNVKQTTMDISFEIENNGGSAITGYQIGYGTDFQKDPTQVVNGNRVTLRKLAPGTRWFVWGRARNAAGWGPWGPYNYTSTTGGGYFYSNGAWRKAVPYVKVNGTWRPAETYVKIAGLWQPAG